MSSFSDPPRALKRERQACQLAERGGSREKGKVCAYEWLGAAVDRAHRAASALAPRPPANLQGTLGVPLLAGQAQRARGTRGTRGAGTWGPQRACRTRGVYARIVRRIRRPQDAPWRRHAQRNGQRAREQWWRRAGPAPASRAPGVASAAPASGGGRRVERGRRRLLARRCASRWHSTRAARERLAGLGPPIRATGPRYPVAAFSCSYLSVLPRYIVVLCASGLLCGASPPPAAPRPEAAVPMSPAPGLV